jgi:hypothetical protein
MFLDQLSVCQLHESYNILSDDSNVKVKNWRTADHKFEFNSKSNAVGADILGRVKQAATSVFHAM